VPIFNKIRQIGKDERNEYGTLYMEGDRTTGPDPGSWRAGREIPFAAPPREDPLWFTLISNRAASAGNHSFAWARSAFMMANSAVGDQSRKVVSTSTSAPTRLRWLKVPEFAAAYREPRRARHHLALLVRARDRDGVAPVVIRILDAAQREGHVASVTLHRHGS
jgi:hypothetical protein